MKKLQVQEHKAISKTMYLFSRVIIAILLLVSSFEDFKNSSIRLKLLVGILFWQVVSFFINFINGYKYLLFERLILASAVIFVYFLFIRKRELLGEADVIFVSMQLISLRVQDFLVFWFSHLILALAFSLLFYKRFKGRTPMYPIYFVSEVILIIRRLI